MATEVTLFFKQNEMPIQAAYGLGFIAMGLIILYYQKKHSGIETMYKHYAFLNSFAFLAVFGIAHGIHELIDLYIKTAPDALWVRVIDIILVVASYAALVHFAAEIYSTERPERAWLRGIALGAAAIFLFDMFYEGLYGGAGIGTAISSHKPIIRYTLGFTGGLFSGLAVLWLSASFEKRGIPLKVVIASQAMGASLVAYGLLTSFFRDPILEIPSVVPKFLVAALSTFAAANLISVFSYQIPEAPKALFGEKPITILNIRKLVSRAAALTGSSAIAIANSALANTPWKISDKTELEGKTPNDMETARIFGTVSNRYREIFGASVTTGLVQYALEEPPAKIPGA